MKPDNIAEISEYEREVGAWISPDGLFFQVYCGDHDDTARRIVDDFLHVGYSVYHSSDWLVALGWIRLETTGRIHHAFQATVQQANILYHIYARAYPGWYKDELFEHIAPLVLSANHVREPLPAVPSQGDQENCYGPLGYRRTQVYAY